MSDCMGVTEQAQEPEPRELLQPLGMCQGQIRVCVRLKPLTWLLSVLLLVHISLSCAEDTAARPGHARVGRAVELPRVPSSVMGSAAPGHTPAPAGTAAAAEPRAFRCRRGRSCSRHSRPARSSSAGWPCLPPGLWPPQSLLQPKGWRDAGLCSPSLPSRCWENLPGHPPERRAAVPLARLDGMSPRVPRTPALPAPRPEPSCALLGGARGAATEAIASRDRGRERCLRTCHRCWSRVWTAQRHPELGAAGLGKPPRGESPRAGTAGAAGAPWDPPQRPEPQLPLPPRVPGSLRGSAGTPPLWDPTAVRVPLGGRHGPSTPPQARPGRDWLG